MGGVSVLAGLVAAFVAVIPHVTSQKCGGEFTSATGEIVSLGYPKAYLPDSSCIWKIKSDPFHTIVLTFKDFELEQHSECRYDFLKIIDGENENARVVGSYCGKNSPGVVRARSDTLSVHFVSDTTTQRKGFVAKWKTEMKKALTPSDCGGSIKTEMGTVISPNYPKSGDSAYICKWFITVPDGGRIKFDFTDFNISPHPECANGYVQLRDGITEKADSLGLFCGSDIPKSSMTKGNMLSIEFLSDGSSAMRGFEMKWVTLYPKPTPLPKEANEAETDCGLQFIDESGSIVRQSSNVDCSWTIDIPRGKNVLISFGELNMRDDPNCEEERLEIRDGSSSIAPLLSKTCGQLKPSTVRSSGNEVFIKHIVSTSSNIRNVYTRLKLYWKSIDSSKKTSIFDSDTCGILKKDDTNSGKKTRMLPWMVGLIGLFNRAHCGGSIISPDWIITAAHCFERLPVSTLWTVRAGESQVLKTGSMEQRRRVRKIVLHPEYNARTYENDIALLKLDRPLTMTKEVNTICLPPSSMLLYEGTKCLVAGWGVTKYASQLPIGPLLHIRPPIISPQKCNETYNGKVTESMICAGDAGLDSCQGDGGGPLSCTVNEKYHVVGLSSWGNGCAFPGKYGVYTDVRGQLRWVREMTNDNKK